MIAIIQYSAGNIRSVQNAVQRLGYEVCVSDDINVLKQAQKVIFPGVGAAPTAMKSLQEKGLDTLIPQLTRPVLGICLGMQLLCKHSEEGNTTGIGIFDCHVRKFSGKERVPQVGWNSIENLNSSLFNKVKEKSDVYFVHSYFAEVCENTIAECAYSQVFSAALSHNNFYATQFHPEKSAQVGEQILANFLSL